MRNRWPLLCALSLLALSLQRAGADIDKEKLRALVRFPSTSGTLQLTYTLRDGYTLTLGDTTSQKSLEAMRAALRGDDSDAERYYQLGNRYSDLGKAAEARAAWEKSLALYRRQIKAHPKNGELKAMLANVLWALQRPAARDQAIAAAIAQAPKSWKVWMVHANIEASDALDALLGRVRETAPVTFDLEHLAAIVQQKPSKTQLHLASTLLDQARQDCKKAIGLAPQESECHSQRAVLMGGARWLISIVQQIALGRPATEVTQKAQADMARTYWGPDVIADFLAAARLSPKDPLAAGTAVYLAFTVGLLAQQNAQAFDPSSGGGLKLLSPARKRSIQPLLEQLQALTKSTDSALAGRGALVLGILQMSLLTPQQAEPTLRLAYRRQPEDPQVIEALMYFYGFQKRWGDMSALLETALKHADKVEWCLMLARAQAQQHHWDEAEQEIERVLKQAPDNFDANLDRCALLLRQARTEAELRTTGEQLIQTYSFYPKSPTTDQTFGYLYLRSIYCGLVGNAVEARKGLADLHGTDDQNTDVEAIKALLRAD